MSNHNSGEMGMLNPDSKLAIFLDHCTALVMNNFLWLICCIPIVTAGAATRAMYANLNAHLNEEACGVRSFFTHMKKDFLPACAIGLVMTAMPFLLMADVALISQSTVPGRMILLGIVGSVALLTALFGSMVFPLMSQFELSFKELVLNAFSLSVAFLPRMIPVVFLNLLPILGMMFIPNFMLRISVFWALMGFALIAMLNLKILNSIFDRLR